MKWLLIIVGAIAAVVGVAAIATLIVDDDPVADPLYSSEPAATTPSGTAPETTSDNEPGSPSTTAAQSATSAAPSAPPATTEITTQTEPPPSIASTPVTARVDTDDDDPSAAGEPSTDQDPAVVPLAGGWRVENEAGEFDCPAVAGFKLPRSVQSGTIEVLDDGATLIGKSIFEDSTTPITLIEDQSVPGRYSGGFDESQAGVTISMQYVADVITERRITGTLNATVMGSDFECTASRNFEMTYRN